jgi:hypothetical protein
MGFKVIHASSALRDRDSAALGLYANRSTIAWLLGEPQEEQCSMLS